MSTRVKAVNQFFAGANRADVDNVKDKIILSDRQDTIFTMFYLQKKDISYISDFLCVSPTVVCRELRKIRDKILPIIRQ